MSGSSGNAMAFVYHIELTNVCDLTCAYCSLTSSERSKGAMGEEVFRKVVAHMQRESPLNFMILHHFGEPLLHPRLAEFVQIAARAELNPGFSTNGERLSAELFERLVQAGLTWMCVAFHTDAGEAAFHEHRERARAAGLVYWGRKLTPTAERYDLGAMLNYGIEHQVLHSFAGTVSHAEEHPEGWRPACDYLDRNFVCVLHDGRVVPCAMDERAAHVLGHVDDLDSVVHQPSYELCRKCQGFTFYEGFRSAMKEIAAKGSFNLSSAGWTAQLERDA